MNLRYSVGMEITINGEVRTFDTPMSVDDLLHRIGFPSAKVAVERNLEIIPKSRYGDVCLVSGDCIEIVRFIGGG